MRVGTTLSRSLVLVTPPLVPCATREGTPAVPTNSLRAGKGKRGKLRHRATQTPAIGEKKKERRHQSQLLPASGSRAERKMLTQPQNPQDWVKIRGNISKGNPSTCTSTSSLCFAPRGSLEHPHCCERLQASFYCPIQRQVSRSMKMIPKTPISFPLQDHPAKSLPCTTPHVQAAEGGVSPNGASPECFTWG